MHNNEDVEISGMSGVHTEKKSKKKKEIILIWKFLLYTPRNGFRHK